MFLLFGSTLVVKIKKSRNPLRAHKKKATEDKENIILLPVDSGLSSPPGDAGIEIVRLWDQSRLFWHKSNSNDPDRNVWSIFVDFRQNLPSPLSGGHDISSGNGHNTQPKHTNVWGREGPLRAGNTVALCS